VLFFEAGENGAGEWLMGLVPQGGIKQGPSREEGGAERVILQNEPKFV
jgi:hypothetical protein